ncbi:DUF58 domain-containing protein [Rhizosaccharibacter radicis]|uniref:DUF58 domain-containing protein n=1 Tax=Rhizosaccharibacter radicis TaxID=2782605 RepID=A0ABT1VXG5_9PROT|nr:DUF58 domain-containing protein [Acetobacteraceae bacterium KSS12]
MEPEALAARLPPLLLAAERVASTVAQGVHGRRRAGQGDSFWQFRQLMPGESATRIDWRQSARSMRAFVREHEWEAAQTAVLWRDASASMAWRSSDSLPFKRDRAELLLLALGVLLMRGGEHVRLAGDPRRTARTGRPDAERLARDLAHLPADAPPLPDADALPAHGSLVMFGDFLSPLPEIERLFATLAARPLRCHLVQVLDPAEQALPYRGRVRFTGLEGEQETLVPDAEAVRTAYRDAFEHHQEGLRGLCGAARFTLHRHDTDRPPMNTLLALHQALNISAAAGRHP